MLEDMIARGELVPVRACDRCARGYLYCEAYDRWHAGACPRGEEAAAWNG